MDVRTYELTHSFPDMLENNITALLYRKLIDMDLLSNDCDLAREGIKERFPWDKSKIEPLNEAKSLIPDKDFVCNIRKLEACPPIVEIYSTNFPRHNPPSKCSTSNNRNNRKILTPNYTQETEGLKFLSRSKLDFSHSSINILLI